MDRLISIGELAELKAVSVDTIRRWEREGNIIVLNHLESPLITG
ncbi:MerR family DNA-binding transcriptional regulator [Nostoc sp. CHAB 5715]|nr:MerR family DNA-binding transcriptional regulator [Nostoc sp. CHAB 5715]MCC5622697.1 MerR family DNA-binding transcriptional regulator [Nostoc sp. CHAB 5715]